VRRSRKTRESHDPNHDLTPKTTIGNRGKRKSEYLAYSCCAHLSLMFSLANCERERIHYSLI
jgi:hypothetical protein